MLRISFHPGFRLQYSGLVTKDNKVFFSSGVPQVAQEIRDQNVHGLSWMPIPLCHIRLNQEMCSLAQFNWCVSYIIMHSDDVCRAVAELVNISAIF